jgi:hypothetical protein
MSGQADASIEDRVAALEARFDISRYRMTRQLEEIRSLVAEVAQMVDDLSIEVHRATGLPRL